jgi:hypothetical protein
MGPGSHTQRRVATRFLGIALLAWCTFSATASATEFGGVTTTWDPATRTITQTYPPSDDATLEGPSGAVRSTPNDHFYCPECPSSWGEVDRLDIHFPQKYTLWVLVPWIFESAPTQIHVYAPATAGGPDTLVGVGIDVDRNHAPAERWNRGYKIAYVGKTIDFGIDGRADVFVEAGDWSAPMSELGDGPDLLDLRRMTNIEYPKNHYGKAEIAFGGCRCNGGDDRYFGNAGLGVSNISLGVGNDRAWVVTSGGSNVDAGPGNDVVHGGPGPDVIYGGNTLRGGVDILYGHGGQDTLAKYGSGRAILNGGPGSDYLSGGSGNDLLIGGGRPFDRGGGDSLLGAGGNDRYVGSGDKDHVIDPWGSTIASLGAGDDDVVVDRRRRHRIDCGPGRRDWIKYAVRNFTRCEVIGSRRR